MIALSYVESELNLTSIVVAVNVLVLTFCSISFTEQYMTLHPYFNNKKLLLLIFPFPLIFVTEQYYDFLVLIRNSSN